MSICPSISPSEGTAKTLLESIDCNIYQMVEQSYGALFAPNSSFAALMTMALTIYIAILGYQLILGRASLNMGELMPRMALIGVILALTTQWSTYQTLVYDVVTKGPQELTMLVAGKEASEEDLASRIDDASNNMNSLAESWTSANNSPQTDQNGQSAQTAVDVPTSSIAQAANAARARANNQSVRRIDNNQGFNSVPSGNINNLSSGPTFLILSSTLLLLIWAGSLAAVKIIIALLLGLGPILLLCALFKSMRGLTIGWVRALLFLTFFPLLTTLTTFAALELIEPIIEGMQQDAEQDIRNLNAALGLFITIITILIMILLTVKVTMIMVSNWGANLLGDKAMTQPQTIETTIPTNMQNQGSSYNNVQQSTTDRLIQSMASNSMNNPPVAANITYNHGQGIYNPTRNKAMQSSLKMPNVGSKVGNQFSYLKPVRGAS